ncbi:MAG: anaerobic sulfatase maturase [Bacteroidales bacterium]|nr:anaerobic sulfatase maturase [Bacteroidales bacterium]
MAVLKNTLTLNDALKISSPLRFNMMFKPVGSVCNLNCSYCYYLDKKKMFSDNLVMPISLLEKIIKEYIQINNNEQIVFDWHGGEPLLLGIDYFKEIVAIQNKYKGRKHVFNTIQTNSTLMNDDFAKFFRDNGFLVGVSIDGPEDIHDKYRKDKDEHPTFMKVMRGIELLHRYEVDFNTLTTINKAGEGRGLDVYLFLKSIGSHYMQFMPVFEHVNPMNNNIVCPDDEKSELTSWSVEPMEYGKYMCDIFDYWVKHDVGDYFVSLFDSTLANYCGVNPGTCVYSETCGVNAVVEHNGDVFPCDHFVYEEYKMGNLNDTSLEKLMSSDMITNFGIDKRNSLPSQCIRCRYFFTCHGECPKHRFSKTKTGEPGLNSLCDGLFYFYSHVEPYMIKMKEFVFERKEAKLIMDYDKDSF